MEALVWKPCKFYKNGSLKQPNIHDNFVYAIAVHLEQRILILHTQYRDGTGPYPLTDLRFLGLVAHYFDDIAEPSILLEIEQVSARWIVKQWKELFDKRKKYGWPPIEAADLDDLSRKLDEMGAHGYRVMGSCGLDGFVLATSMEYCPRKQKAEFCP